MGDVWSPLLLFLFVIGGLYGGLLRAHGKPARSAPSARSDRCHQGKLNGDGVGSRCCRRRARRPPCSRPDRRAVLRPLSSPFTQTPQHVTEFF